MPRFAGVPVQAEPTRKPRFSGVATGAPEEPSRGSLIAPLTQGMSFGFADELAGAVRGGARAATSPSAGALIGGAAAGGFKPGDQVQPDTFGRAYEEERDVSRQRVDEAREDSPWLSTGAEIVGGIATAGGALAAAPKAAGRLLGLGGSSVRGKVGASAASGAGLGAVGGAGSADGDMADRAQGALVGAGVGGIVGAGTVPVAAGIGKGANALLGAMAARGGPISGRASRMVSSDLAAEGTNIGEVGAKAKALGDQAMLADASEMLRLRTEQIANSPVPGRTDVISAMRDRTSGARERIGSAYDATMGDTPDVQATLDGILTQRSAAARPLYEKALAQPVAWDNRLQSFIDDPIVKGGLARGVEIQRLESLADDVPFNPTDYAITGFNDAGDPIIGQVPNFRTLNVVKKGLDALVEDNKTEFGKLTERGRAIDGVRRSFLGKLDSINPDYAAARASWEGPTKTLGAFENGRGLFGAKVHPDTLKRDFERMSEAEREAFQLGTRAAVDEAMGRVRNGSLKGRQLLDSDFNERRILTVFGEDEGKRLISVLNGEEAMAQTANQTLSNSATARRVQGNPFSGKGPVDLNSVPQSLFHAGRLALQRGADTAARGSRERLAAELGPALTARGAERDALVEALAASETRRGAAATDDPARRALIQAMTQGGSLAYARREGR